MHFDAALLCSYNIVQFFILSSQIASFYAKISLSSTSCTTMEASSTSTNRGDDALMPPEATKRFFWYNLSFHVRTFGWSAKKWNDDTCTYKLYISWEKKLEKNIRKNKKKIFDTVFPKKIRRIFIQVSKPYLECKQSFTNFTKLT